MLTRALIVEKWVFARRTSHNNHKKDQPSSSSLDAIYGSDSNVYAMRPYISSNHRPNSGMDVVLKQICDGVPGISQHIQLVIAFIESVSHFYKTFMNLNNTASERPLDLSYQRHTIKPELHDILRQACYELIENGAETVLQASGLASKFLETINLIVKSNSEIEVEAPASISSQRSPSATSSPTSLLSKITERIDLLLQNWGEFTVKHQALIDSYQKIPYVISGVNSPPPLSSAPAVPTTSAVFTSTSGCLPPPPLLAPAPSLPTPSSWSLSFPNCNQPRDYFPPHLAVNFNDRLFMLSQAARLVASNGAPEIGPLSVDVNSPPSDAISGPYAHSDVGPRLTDWTQPGPPPPPTPGPSTSTTLIGRSRAQSLSNEIKRRQNMYENSISTWSANKFASDALITLSAGISGSATPFTTPNELHSNNESPPFQGHQSTLQSENSESEPPHTEQNMENIDSSNMLMILATANSHSPSTSSMATVDTAQTSPQFPTRDKRASPKSDRIRTKQRPKSPMQQDKSPKTTRTSTPPAEKSVILDALEERMEIFDETDGTACQNTHSNSPQSKDSPHQGKFLMLDDLRDKLRILVVEDNRLRKATVFTCNEQSQKDESALSSAIDKNPYTRTWRIQLDPLDDSDESRRRRCTEEDFQAWALLQKAVLHVSPEYPDQLIPGTRVCATWSATLGNVYFPGRITEAPPIRSPNEGEMSFPIQFDDGDSTLVSFKSILLLPNDYKNPKGPCPLPSGRRRYRSPVMPLESPSNRPTKSSRRNSRIGEDDGKAILPSLMPNTGNGDKPDTDVPIKALTQKVVWTPIGEPLKTRCKGMICYEALQRNIDNLIVKLNDTVTFLTNHSSEIYLGRIHQIYATKRNMFKVTANWLYTPSEMGHAGKIITKYEGAVFTSNHYDDNEAVCISGLVRVSNSYSEFLKSLAAERRKISADSSANTRKRRRLTVLDSDEESDRKSSDVESNEDSQQLYFIAGEFDFREGRIVSWDKDLARELHLPSTKNHS